MAGIAELGLIWLVLTRRTLLVRAAVVCVARALVLPYVVTVGIGLPSWPRAPQHLSWSMRTPAPAAAGTTDGRHR